MAKFFGAALLAASLLAGCAADDLSKPPPAIGDFRLGYDIVVADNAEPAGPSRKATPDEWEAALKKAIDADIGRYQGDKLYHLGVALNAYALAVPGIPIVLSPKSVVVLTVDVWDDTAQRPVNAKGKRLTVFEGISGSTMVGSGLTKTREQQMETLSKNAAAAIAKWLEENKAWFTPEAVAARKLLPPVTKAQVTAKPPAAATTAPAAPATN
jgi:outer membrane murein-binding lipoprotein Lpp